MPMQDPSPRRAGVDDLAALLRGRTAAVLTGAGCSTESGIPDYRSPESLRRPRTPIKGREFVGSAEVRRRYWARSIVGWQRFGQARPNAAHRALAALEEGGRIAGIVTQNVDGLHGAAGSRRVVELHGNLAQVVCLGCGATEPRDAVQARLLDDNPGFLGLAAASAPDGDADLPAERIADFRVVDCLRCGGPLKPQVVFFGENVARPVVDEAFELCDGAEALLVVGTSLTVFSGYRFLLRAAERGVPVALVNVGAVRGQELCRLHVEARAGEVLQELCDRLGSPPAPTTST